MVVLLISSTMIFGLITGLLSFGKGEILRGIIGQVVHGLLSLACFGLVGVGFWRFGWKVGVIDLGLLVIASNTALTCAGYFRKRLRLPLSNTDA